jgi:hypothetical protein
LNRKERKDREEDTKVSEPMDDLCALGDLGGSRALRLNFDLPAKPATTAGASRFSQFPLFPRSASPLLLCPIAPCPSGKGTETKAGAGSIHVNYGVAKSKVRYPDGT